ncbi:uncharacterized protein FOMMEDRAFT_95450 [Fomitiporia mediterranea MF3/22]|uniref:uncharacterized protein n=1 Tax=Fomitiporia mediterranea (strain MF3/22) TaxID=694068 RepID=UPI0004407FD4|nr:uncharacterized protein FOMMEDRAFT_95450 [Fomitiporia mediterranea MF3/22]EJC98863.1 hypothetical protein FOMMEDRAFT_95450 [Fomitiporia mediterranea MF3/22]
MQQNHIHELAKTLPPPRRQNVACDACRTRKVRCTQLPGQDKCQHCIAKNYPCTYVDPPPPFLHYVQQQTSEKKRGTGASRRARAASAANPRRLPAASALLTLSINRSSGPETSLSNGQGNKPYGTQYSLFLPYQLPNSRGSPKAATTQLLAYLFSPEGPTDPASFSASARGRSPTYHDWGEMSIRLESEAFRIEFALDLVEVFFQICHTRLPLLNPTQFRSRLKFALAPPQSPAPAEKPLHPALLATVIAWGAKFSEHPLLIADREGAGGQSRLARTLVNRAREVAEAEKVHRISSVDHVVIALLIEPLQNQTPEDPDYFHGFWLTCAIRHLLFLQINHKSVMTNIQDPESRGTMIFAWWMACLADAYHSAYYRRKPQLDDDDYDIDFYTVDPIPPEVHDVQSVSLSPREQYEVSGYYRAAHALARICRHMSKQLWRPTTESDGIPFDVLCNIVSSLNDWREEHLPRVGVPSDFESEWDFVSAVSACASDATYHVMWVIVFNAVDDFGIKEFNEAVRLNALGNVPANPTIESVKHKILDEALHGALRIAGLTGVLTSNGYLKLDPAVMHFSCLTAGTLLARLGRPEVTNCIGGLKQYNYAYEEAGDEAIEMERIYSNALNGDSDVNHMASVVLPQHQHPGATAAPGGASGGAHNQGQAMVVDPPSYGTNGPSGQAVNQSPFA